MTKNDPPKATSKAVEKKQSVMEQLWLNYYNDTLFEQGVITEDMRNRMRVAIKTRRIKQSKGAR